MKLGFSFIAWLKASILRHHRLIVAVGQAVFIAASLVGAFLLRFDLTLPGAERHHLLFAIAIAVPLKLVVFALTGLNYGWMRFAGLPDLGRLAQANLFGSSLLTVALYSLMGPAFPRSIYILDLLLCFMVMATLRFAVRLYKELITAQLPKSGRKRLLIYGAGSAGIALYRELRANPSLGYDIIGFIDDDRKKQKVDFLGARVICSGRGLVHLPSPNNPIDEVIIAMPSATGRQMREAVANCRAANIPCKTVPGIAERMNGRALSHHIRNIEIKDLLGREPVRLEEARIRQHIANRVVLVTGGAGSIGSELCRQVAGFGPRRLVVLDRAESDLFRIDNELRQKFPAADISSEIASIRDAHRLSEIIQAHSVDVIFHAAAYKHVPMMEKHVREAVENNVIGTWNLAKVAYQNGVRDLLMISSDKAVNPTSIMGLTKRISEIIVAARATEEGSNWAKWVSVRFGNVLGSNGSVVPIFQAQIMAGGPVTVTHPEMRRYFMTIPEAVQLVLQASTMGHASDIFVLDMGEPIKILDLAKNMIRICGFEPGEDIDIRFTGMRPGEKLFEELQTSGEHIQPTYHNKIKIFRGHRASQREVQAWMDELPELLARSSTDDLIAHMRDLVPEYKGGPERIAVRAIGA